jgi:MFS family permease
MNEAIADMALQPTEQQRHLRRNIAAFMADFGGFGGGFALIHPTTVLPVLARQLTSSAPLVGLLTTVWTGCWLLPQLPAGRWLCNKPRKKPVLILATAMGRPILLAVSALLIFARPSDSTVILIGLFLGVIIFRATDAVASVGWFDIFGKAIPTNRRGRVVSAGQILGGLLALGAAITVRWALGPSGPQFPRNFALLFALAFGGMIVSWLGLITLVEPSEPIGNSAPQQMNAIEHAHHVVRDDRAFRLVTAVRLLTGLTGMALPFYVVHATRELGLPNSFVGLAVAAQNIIAIIASLGLGMVSERVGSARVIHISALASTTTPLLALILHALYALGSHLTLIGLGYLLAFAAISIVDNSFMLGYLNYVIEIAPPRERPAYVGLINTISGVLVVLPLVGGALLQVTSYPALFGIAATGAVSGLLLSMRLPAPREQ